jgi:hypothetical protein
MWPTHRAGQASSARSCVICAHLARTTVIRCMPPAHTWVQDSTAVRATWDGTVMGRHATTLTSVRATLARTAPRARSRHVRRARTRQGHRARDGLRHARRQASQSTATRVHVPTALRTACARLTGTLTVRRTQHCTARHVRLSWAGRAASTSTSAYRLPVPTMRAAPSRWGARHQGAPSTSPHSRARVPLAMRTETAQGTRSSRTTRLSAR